MLLSADDGTEDAATRESTIEERAPDALTEEASDRTPMTGELLAHANLMSPVGCIRPVHHSHFCCSQHPQAWVAAVRRNECHEPTLLLPTVWSIAMVSPGVISTQ